MLRTYPTCSYPGYQDTTTYAALHETCHYVCRVMCQTFEFHISSGPKMTQFTVFGVQSGPWEAQAADLNVQNEPWDQVNGCKPAPGRHRGGTKEDPWCLFCASLVLFGASSVSPCTHCLGPRACFAPQSPQLEPPNVRFGSESLQLEPS